MFLDGCLSDIRLNARHTSGADTLAMQMVDTGHKVPHTVWTFSRFSIYCVPLCCGCSYSFIYTTAEYASGCDCLGDDRQYRIKAVATAEKADIK